MGGGIHLLPTPSPPVRPRVNIPETNFSYFDVARLLNLILQYNGQHNEMEDWRFKQYNLKSKNLAARGLWTFFTRN